MRGADGAFSRHGDPGSRSPEPASTPPRHVRRGFSPRRACRKALIPSNPKEVVDGKGLLRRPGGRKGGRTTRFPSTSPRFSAALARFHPLLSRLWMESGLCGKWWMRTVLVRRSRGRIGARQGARLLVRTLAGFAGLRADDFSRRPASDGLAIAAGLGPSPELAQCERCRADKPDDAHDGARQHPAGHVGAKQDGRQPRS